MDQKIIYKSVNITIRRDDLLHPFVSGNKFRKLKYNIKHIINNDFKGIITFGGAFSNHIAATSAAANLYNIPSVGIIRGDELKNNSNHTLKFAHDNNMKLHFVSRNEYREKIAPNFITQLHNNFPNYFVVPEGGSNELAILGCEEIIDSNDSHYNYIASACGTGATISGIINSSNSFSKILGFAALNDYSMEQSISKWVNGKANWKIIYDYNLGGYAKIDEGLILFINEFFNKFGVPLDPIYTGKMFYGIFDLIDKGFIKGGEHVLAIHTGGLQGIAGMNEKLKKKNSTLIQVKF